MFQLNHEVTLLRNTAPRRGERGGQSYSNYQQFPALAHLQQAAGRQVTQGQFTINTDLRRLVVRRNPSITTSWRVLVDGEVLNVKSVQPVSGRPQHRNFQRLVCQAADVSVLQVTSGTGPQPVFLQLPNVQPGAGDQRRDFDLTGQTGTVQDQPRAGDTIRFQSAPGASLAGRYVIVLYPSAWGEPTTVHWGADRALNQIGAFRFVPANLRGVTAELGGLYTAMVSNNRKASDTPLDLTLGW